MNCCHRASRLFRFVLFLLGIRHQRTDLHCPRQNGRVERFFGTLKHSLNRLAVDSIEAVMPAWPYASVSTGTDL